MAESVTSLEGLGEPVYIPEYERLAIRRRRRQALQQLVGQRLVRMMEEIALLVEIERRPTADITALCDSLNMSRQRVRGLLRSPRFQHLRSGDA